MDRFGFNTISQGLKKIEREFLIEGIKLEQEEISNNFSGEVNSESNQGWNELVYRDPPPQILDLTGAMKERAISGQPTISGNEAILSIDPIDSRGRHYAAYHEQDGTGEFGTSGEGGYGANIQREFVTQSKVLTQKQESLLINLCDKVFSK